MLTAKRTLAFKRDVKRMEKRGKNMDKLRDLVLTLINEKPLAKRYVDHALKGDYKGQRECHIEPDWLLVYYLSKKERIIVFTRTGTHSDLFSK